ncbi:unnamed protein product [Clavelina lepadiformis]|uniref:Thyroglobulin type-1 domain-containing protein n=1 Tax=Clavelina lepadiformis TaxID=159417 RepID=A0ABP0FL17_CLALP
MTSYLVLSLTLLVTNCVIVQCEDSLVARLITSTSPQHATTSCHEERERALWFRGSFPGLAHLLDLPQCRPDGTFEPLFCSNQSDVENQGLSLCYCVNPGTGQRVSGSVVVTAVGTSRQNIQCSAD